LFARGAGAAVIAGAAAGSARAQAPRPLVWGGNLPAALDPHTVLDVPSVFLKVNLYDSLYEYAGDPPEPRPVLAKSQRVSADGREWSFELVPGVRFHDGSELTAEDVVYSFQRMLALKRGPAVTFAAFLAPEGVVASARHEVRFTLKEIYAPFVSTLPMVAIVNRKLVEANTKDNDWGQAWLAANDAGSGPYRAVPGSFKPLENLDMEWFEPYFRGWPHNRQLKEVRVRPIKDDTTRVLAVEKGDIDTTHSYIRPDQHKRLQNAPGVVLSIEPAMRTFLVRMHNGRAPFNNVHFRRAMACAFPYELFIERMLLGTVERNPTPLPNQLWGNPAGVSGYRYDLAKAREHLELARRDGVDTSREIDFLALVGFDETEQLAQLMQSELRKLGIRMKISKSLWANALTATQKEETSPDIWAHWATSYFIDPDNWTGQFYAKGNLGTQRGSSWYRNDTVDGLLLRARSTLDRAERTRLYEEATRALVDESVDLWIYNSKTFRAIRTRLKGYKPAAVGDGVDLRGMWLEG
jgi:peptide/nickel transport system substrate-binding protein